MRRPANASFDPATASTAKAGQPYRDLAEMRRHRMIPIVLHPASGVATAACRPTNGMIPGLSSDDLLLQARQQPLSFVKGQTEIGNITEIIGSADRHDIDALFFPRNLGFY